jgi:hypothetical protein
MTTAKLNPTKTMKKLLQMRSTIGADTPAGHRISNIDEIRQNRAKITGLEQSKYLEANLARQLADLEATRHRR